MDDLISKLSSSVTGDEEMCVSQAELVRWAAETRSTYAELLNSLGAELAKAYSQGELSYEVCDKIANDVWYLLIKRVSGGDHDDWPETFYKVYEAFDAGEYHRRADQSDDPVADFTDPAIAELLCSLCR